MTAPIRLTDEHRDAISAAFNDINLFRIYQAVERIVTEHVEPVAQEALTWQGIAYEKDQQCMAAVEAAERTLMGRIETVFRDIDFAHPVDCPDLPCIECALAGLAIGVRAALAPSSTENRCDCADENGELRHGRWHSLTCPADRPATNGDDRG